jgi:hypothetical protein
VDPCRASGDLRPDEQPPRVPHGDLVAWFIHVDVGLAEVAALVAEVVAALSNPAGGLVEFGG